MRRIVIAILCVSAIAGHAITFGSLTVSNLAIGVLEVPAGNGNSNTNVTFVLLSDPHFGRAATFEAGEPKSNFRYIMTNFGPTFVLTTGDIDDDAGDDYAAAIDAYSVFSVTHKEIFGNHDLWNSQNNAAGFPIWMAHIGYSNFVYTYGNYRFIGIGTYQGSYPGPGTLTTGMLDWLENQLSNRPAGSVDAVMSHHPVTGKFPPLFGITNWNVNPGEGLERLTNLLTTYSVPLYFHGHTHAESNTMYVLNGVTTQYCLPSLAYSIGATNRTGNANGAFNIFSLTNSTMTIRQYEASISNGYPLLGTYTFTVPKYTNSAP